MYWIYQKLNSKWFYRREANPAGKSKKGKKGKGSKGGRKPKGGRGQRAPGKKAAVGRKRR